MKSNAFLRLNVIACTALALATGEASATPPSSNHAVFDVQTNVFGMSYGDWVTAWWQYIYAIPKGTNPTLPNVTSGSCDPEAGPVCFLAAIVSNSNVTTTRHWTIKAGMPIFFPIINAECSTVEASPFFGKDEAALRTCVSKLVVNNIDSNSLKVTLDNREIRSLPDYRVQSPVFGFTLPKDNILGVTTLTGQAVSDGYWLMLKPLDPGKHTLKFSAKFKGDFAGNFINMAFVLNVMP
jgi:hypothetical protein